MTVNSRMAPGGNHGSLRTEGTYITTSGGGSVSGNHVQGRYVTLPGGVHDETQASYVSVS